MTVKDLKKLLEQYSDDTVVKDFNDLWEVWEPLHDWDLKFYPPKKKKEGN